MRIDAPTRRSSWWSRSSPSADRRLPDRRLRHGAEPREERGRDRARALVRPGRPTSPAMRIVPGPTVQYRVPGGDLERIDGARRAGHRRRACSTRRTHAGRRRARHQGPGRGAARLHARCCWLGGRAARLLRRSAPRLYRLLNRAARCAGSAAAAGARDRARGAGPAARRAPARGRAARGVLRAPVRRSCATTSRRASVCARRR